MTGGASLTVGEAVARRRSCRAFLPDPVQTELVLDILRQAARAPSGANIQPWQVHLLTGEARARLVRRVHELAPEMPLGEGPDYTIHPEMTPAETARYQAASGAMYDAVGISRDDAAARLDHRLRNWRFFDAPIGLILTIERRMQPGQWADVGMFAQTVMLLALEHGLETCAQESWSLWPGVIREQLGLDAEHIVYAGIAIGYPDLAHPINAIRSDRADLPDYVTVHD
jgi:nitroreductase